MPLQKYTKLHQFVFLLPLKAEFDGHQQAFATYISYGWEFLLELLF